MVAEFAILINGTTLVAEFKIRINGTTVVADWAVLPHATIVVADWLCIPAGITVDADWRVLSRPGTTATARLPTTADERVAMLLPPGYWDDHHEDAGGAKMAPSPDGRQT